LFYKQVCFITARCTTVQSAVLLSHVVRLSVTLVDLDVENLGN